MKLVCSQIDLRYYYLENGLQDKTAELIFLFKSLKILNKTPVCSLYNLNEFCGLRKDTVTWTKFKKFGKDTYISQKPRLLLFMGS